MKLKKNFQTLEEQSQLCKHLKNIAESIEQVAEKAQDELDGGFFSIEDEPGNPAVFQEALFLAVEEMQNGFKILKSNYFETEKKGGNDVPA